MGCGLGGGPVGSGVGVGVGCVVGAGVALEVGGAIAGAVGVAVAVGVGWAAALGCGVTVGCGVARGEEPVGLSRSVCTGVGGGPVVSRGTLELQAERHSSSRSPRNPTTRAR